MGKWNAPADCKYTLSDEWVRVEGNEAVIGITDYAQDKLSDLVYVDLQGVKVGDTLGRGETCSTVESVKAAAPVSMPISGEIIAINSELDVDLGGSPELINQDPYGKGWIVRIRPADLSELDDLMDAGAYSAYCDSRE